MNLQKNVLLKNYSNYKIGGPAKYFAEVTSIDELKEVLNACQNEKIFILGGGTKVLINDKGFDGLVIYSRIGGIEKKGNNLIVGSGVSTKDILDYCIENSLSGLEWAGGLPGTIGGAVRGNSGSFNGEIKDSVLKVEGFDLKTLVQKIRSNSECNFDYRNSTFKSGDGTNEFIVRVTLGLTLGDSKEIKEKIQQKIEYRKNRHPMEYPSIGSVFKNIPLDTLSPQLQKEFSTIIKIDPFPVVLITKLLVLCGLSGKRVGDAVISEKQPNFIINIGNAKATDVKALIEIAKQAVKEKYNLNLEEEIIYLD